LTLAPIELAILQQSAFLSRKTIWIGQNTGKAKWGNVHVIQAGRWRVGAGRFFNGYKQNSFRELVMEHASFVPCSIWITDDVKPDYISENLKNIVIR
jgi:hypothetical protein